MTQTTVANNSRPALPHIWVAIPDSCLSDEQTKRDKSVKVSQIARTCSIFRTEKIFVYKDPLSSIERRDPLLLKTILRYLDTPQYLRRILYPKMDELEYAGMLHPIKAPHHRPLQDIRKFKIGDTRPAVLVNAKGKLFAEAGLGSPIPFDGSGFEGKKINVKFVSTFPDLRVSEAKEEEIREYWGYQVRDAQSLSKLLKNIESTEVIITSRKGIPFAKKENQFLESAKSAKNLLVVFGAPKYGIQEILAKEGSNTRSYQFVVNMFPNQGTETVRMEEALLGSLAILNNTISKLDH
jgi:predicted SPOUT superfamily RNA methylase MTH1